MNNRNITLDLAKGLLITLVVFGHAIQYSWGPEYTLSRDFFLNIVFRAIYSFHMPLFMTISGYFFYNSNKKGIKDLACSKLISIGVPMLSFIILCNFQIYIPYILNGDIIGFLIRFVNLIIRGGTMWFLFSLLLNMAILAITTRVVKNQIFQYGTLVLFFIGSMFISDAKMPSTYKFMFPFFCMGYIMKACNLALYRGVNNKTILAVLTLLSILAIYWFDSNTYIYNSGFCIVSDYIGHLFLNVKRIVIALIVSYTFLQFIRILSSMTLTTLHKIFIRLGQISLFVYGFNIFFDTIYTMVLKYYHKDFELYFYIPVIFTITVISLSLCLNNIFEKNTVTSFLFLGKEKKV